MWLFSIQHNTFLQRCARLSIKQNSQPVRANLYFFFGRNKFFSQIEDDKGMQNISVFYWPLHSAHQKLELQKFKTLQSVLPVIGIIRSVKNKTPLMIPITGETDCRVLSFQFLTCNVLWYSLWPTLTSTFSNRLNSNSLISCYWCRGTSVGVRRRVRKFIPDCKKKFFKRKLLLQKLKTINKTFSNIELLWPPLGIW